MHGRKITLNEPYALFVFDIDCGENNHTVTAPFRIAFTVLPLKSGKDLRGDFLLCKDEEDSRRQPAVAAFARRRRGCGRTKN
jgi:hypothetical protein